MTGKKYSFAAMELITTELGLSYCNDSYEHDAEVACSFMQLLSLKAALQQWGTDAEDAGVKEVSQLHWRDMFVPNTYSNFTGDEKQKDIENLMFVVKMSGNKVLLVECWDAIYGLLRNAGPASMQACITSTVVEMTEESDNPVDLVDVAEADWDNQNTMLLNVDNNITEVCPHDHNDEVIDGTMIVGLLYYRKFSESLAEQGYVANAYDLCVWNKVIQGKQSTISFHVDDCKISHVSEKVNEDTISWLRRDYESIFTDGSGEMKVTRGKVHKYLGMKLDFTNIGVVTVTMIDYIDDVIKAWDEAVTKFKMGLSAR
jgi:hypothetical protein